MDYRWRWRRWWGHQQCLVKLRHIDGVREIQRQQDHQRHHHAMAKNRNEKIIPGAWLLQVRGSHHSFVKLRFLPLFTPLGAAPPRALCYTLPREKIEIRQPQFSGKARIPREKCQRIFCACPETRPQRLEQNARRDSLGCAARRWRDHQLRNPCLQNQESARMVRRLLRPLQLVPDCRDHRQVQKPTESLLHLQRDHPLPAGQAPPDSPDQDNRESPCRPARTQTTLTPHSYHLSCEGYSQTVLLTNRLGGRKMSRVKTLYPDLVGAKGRRDWR